MPSNWQIDSAAAFPAQDGYAVRELFHLGSLSTSESKSNPLQKFSGRGAVSSVRFSLPVRASS